MREEHEQQEQEQQAHSQTLKSGLSFLQQQYDSMSLSESEPDSAEGGTKRSRHGGGAPETESGTDTAAHQKPKETKKERPEVRTSRVGGGLLMQLKGEAGTFSNGSVDCTKLSQIKVNGKEVLMSKLYEGVCRYPNGQDPYKGEINYKGLPHGEGVYFRESGMPVYGGQWKNGSPCGFRVLYSEGGVPIYQGQVKGSEAHCLGTKLFTNGKPRKIGQCDNGACDWELSTTVMAAI